MLKQELRDLIVSRRVYDYFFKIVLSFNVVHDRNGVCVVIVVHRFRTNIEFEHLLYIIFDGRESV